MSFRKSFVVVSLVAAAACTGGDDTTADSAAASQPAAARSAEEQLEEVGKYRLTMAQVDKYFEAQRNFARAVAAMSPAEREAMKAASDAEDTSDDSMQDMAKRFGAHAVYGPAIQKAGLSAGEYTAITLAIMQAGMAEAVVAMRPADDPDSLARAMRVNPANIAFMREHRDELTRKGQAVAAEMKAAGLDND